jgi:hypothetical protein
MTFKERWAKVEAAWNWWIAKIEAFRQRVGGNISIFIYACLFLLYPAVLIPAAVYEAGRGHWRDAAVMFVLGLVMIPIARLFYLFEKWLWALSDRFMDWVGRKLGVTEVPKDGRTGKA